MLCALVYSMLLCELSFTPNGCVKESKICIPILTDKETEAKRGLSCSEANSNTGTLPRKLWFVPLPHTTKQCEVLFSQSCITCQSPYVNQERTMIQNPRAVPRSCKLPVLTTFLSGTAKCLSPPSIDQSLECSNNI